MSAVKAADVTRGRWQLDAEVETQLCGCRWAHATDGTSRRVATCRGHRRNVGAPLVPWAPA